MYTTYKHLQIHMLEIEVQTLLVKKIHGIEINLTVNTEVLLNIFWKNVHAFMIQYNNVLMI